SGTVTLDGKPVPRGNVRFTPQAGRGALGIIRPDGSYTMSTYAEGDGVVVGPSKIAVFVRLGEDATQEELAKLVRIPARYASAGTSGLSHEVTPGEANVVNLELTS